MDKHIYIIAAMLMVMFINSTSIAQGQKEKEVMEIAEIQTRKMKKYLNLSEEQFQIVSQINIQFMNDLQEAMKDKENEILLTEARVLKTINERNESYLEVLNDDQMSEMLLWETKRLFSRNRHRLN